ncbi:MAG TPA: oxidoreductase [Galbitalea sp.]|jgi:NAD(P)-dependent dehydrogenase (short-subunit alcohol dehydrogenase family)|nr:oxidoreductase [Galbitalea sp.]
MPRWRDTDVPDQTGRVALVTGATGGLGLRVAEVLAGHGARVLVGSRNTGRGSAALARVDAAASGARPELVSLDVSSLESVAAAVERLSRRIDGRLDLLINNAGIMSPPLEFSPDGFELQWATNVLGPAALTWRLLPAIESTPGSRVVFVSSSRHASATLDGARIRADVRGDDYRGFDYYGRTKLADLLLTDELERHLRRTGADSMAVAAHPGFTATGIVGSGFASLPRAVHPIANWGMRTLGQPVSIGALPILYAATAAGVMGSDYFAPRGLNGMRGHPRPTPRSPGSHNAEVAATLVKVVSELIGLPAPR